MKSALVAATSLLVVLIGCSRPTARPPASRRKTVEAAIRAVDPAGLAASVAKYQGKVVLVDFWATWCEPCRELFPHTVALEHELGGQGLAVITVSVDEPEDEPAVRKFLAAQGAESENLRAKTGASPRSATEFGIENGAIPFMQVYDRSGKLRKTLLAPIKPDEIDDAVKKLLAEKQPLQ